MQLTDKIKEAEEILRFASELSQYYYNEPIIISYSGGKDSDVMLDIARHCLKPSEFAVGYSNTTVDAPETYQHIRAVFKELEEEGIKTIGRQPTYKGEPTSMYKLIPEKRMPPTRLVRYCCEILKEGSWGSNITCVGVREDESQGRKGRDIFAVLGKKKNYYSPDHVKAQFENSKEDQKELNHGNNEVDAYDCKVIENLKKNKNIVVSPIYKFTENDVLRYIILRDVRINPLYNQGFKRVGCIGCPLAGDAGRKRELARYPKYKNMYIRAFDNMLRVRKERGLKDENWKTGLDVYRRWIGEDPKQIRIEDIIQEGK